MVLGIAGWTQFAVAQTPTSQGIEAEDAFVSFGETVEVPAMETGRVAAIDVAQNDSVNAGAPIARLDDRSLLIRRRAALLRVNSARAESTDEIELRYAELALAEAEAELETSRAIQNDVLGAVPHSQVRKLKLAVERGQLEVAQAKKRRSRAGVELELREADLAVIDDQLRNLHVESPIDGIVVKVSRSAGEWVAKGETIATVGRLDRLHVHALLRRDQIPPAVCRGLPVSVLWLDRSTQSERSLRGKVLSVDPQMLPGGQFAVHAEIRNRAHGHEIPQWVLLPGTEVRMKVFPSAATAHQRGPLIQR